VSCAPNGRLLMGLVLVGTHPRTASGGRARAGPGPSTRLRAAWVVFRGTAPVLAGASAVRARAQWPPDCAWTWQGLGPRRGSGAWRPEDPLYAVQGAPSAISCLEPRAVRAGAQGRRSGGAGPLIHTAGDRRGEFRPRRSTARERAKPPRWSGGEAAPRSRRAATRDHPPPPAWLRQGGRGQLREATAPARPAVGGLRGSPVCRWRVGSGEPAPRGRGARRCAVRRASASSGAAGVPCCCLPCCCLRRTHGWLFGLFLFTVNTGRATEPRRWAWPRRPGPALSGERTVAVARRTVAVARRGGGVVGCPLRRGSLRGGRSPGCSCYYILTGSTGRKAHRAAPRRAAPESARWQRRSWSTWPRQRGAPRPRMRRHPWRRRVRCAQTARRGGAQLL